MKLNKRHQSALAFALTPAILATGFASAVEISGQFGWEDGTSTVFGEFPAAATTYSNTTAGSEFDYGTSEVAGSTYNVTPFEGARMLQVTEIDTAQQNPNIVIGWLDGLVAGDTFSFSVRTYDPSDERSPSMLTSAVYTNTDANSFAGFASPFQEFGNYPGTGWLLNQSDAIAENIEAGIQPVYTFDPGTDRTGVALRVQLFAPSASLPANGGTGEYKYFIDDLNVTLNSSSPNARIVFADGSQVLVPEPGSLALLGLGGLLVARRRRSA